MKADTPKSAPVTASYALRWGALFVFAVINNLFYVLAGSAAVVIARRFNALQLAAAIPGYNNFAGLVVRTANGLVLEPVPAWLRIVATAGLSGVGLVVAAVGTSWNACVVGVGFPGLRRVDYG